MPTGPIISLTIDGAPSSSKGPVVSLTIDGAPASSKGPVVSLELESLPSFVSGSQVELQADGAPKLSSGAQVEAQADGAPGESSGPQVEFETTEADLLPVVLAGTRSRNPPDNFRVVDTKATSVTLGWDDVTTITDDYLELSEDGEDFAGAPGAGPEGSPANVIAHKRTVLGYILHKGDPDFVPEGTAEGEGNVLADETTLPAGTTEYVDYAVSPGDTISYILATVIDDGF